MSSTHSSFTPNDLSASASTLRMEGQRLSVARQADRELQIHVVYSVADGVLAAPDRRSWLSIAGIRWCVTPRRRAIWRRDWPSPAPP